MADPSISPTYSGFSSRLLVLINHARKGDCSSLDELLRKYRPYLRVLCAMRLPPLCRKREDASDIVQQTLIDAAGGMQELRANTEAEFEGWIVRLLERNILQSLRRNTAEKRDIRREHIDQDPHDSATLIWHTISADQSAQKRAVFQGEAALQLAEALERLPGDQRIAVEMRYLRQESLKSIAKEMNKTVGAIAGLIRRGVENLRDIIPANLEEAD